jgi:hypothetical protein
MLQSKQLVDILATLLMTCLGLLGWTQVYEEHIYEEHSFKTETLLAGEPKLLNLVEERLCSNDYNQIDFQNTSIITFANCSKLDFELTKPIAIKSYARQQ